LIGQPLRKTDGIRFAQVFAEQGFGGLVEGVFDSFDGEPFIREFVVFERLSSAFLKSASKTLFPIWRSSRAFRTMRMVVAWKERIKVG